MPAKSVSVFRRQILLKLMKRVFVTALCISLMASIGFSQVRKPNPKPTAKPVIITITELSSAEWNEITTSLEAEDWDKTALLSGNFLKKLKTENDKKQLARLRYFYLFALAGKVSQGKMTNSELQNIAQTFIGKDFITLDRNVLNNCDKSFKLRLSKQEQHQNRPHNCYK